MIGSRNVKNAASRLRQKSRCWSRSSWQREPSLLLAGQLEVDVLERAAAHLEPLELLAARRAPRGQLVQDAGRLVVLEDDLARRRGGSGSRRARRPARSSRGEPVATMRPSRRIASRSARRLRLLHVVRRQEDRLAERAQAADRLPGAAARRGVEAGRRLVEEDELGVADEREREVEPPQLAARERADARSRCSSRPTSSITSSGVERRRVVAGEELARSRAP